MLFQCFCRIDPDVVDALSLEVFVQNITSKKSSEPSRHHHIVILRFVQVPRPNISCTVPIDNISELLIAGVFQDDNDTIGTWWQQTLEIGAPVDNDKENTGNFLVFFEAVKNCPRGEKTRLGLKMFGGYHHGHE